MLLTSIPISAHDFKVDGIWYKISSSRNKTVKVTYDFDIFSYGQAVGPDEWIVYEQKYEIPYTGEIIIPSSVSHNGTTYSVTEIEDSVLLCPTTIKIGDNITSIKSGLFSGCTCLTSISIGNSITSISEGLFYGCTGLTSISMPNSVTSIGSDAFYGCTGLTSITIPNSVASIGSSAFYGCTGLTSISMPNSVTSIEKNTFNGCTNLASITIPNSVTEICDYAFSGCNNLASITIPNSITKIGDYTFQACKKLKSIIFEDGTKLLSIGSQFNYGEKISLFYNCPIDSLYLGRNYTASCPPFKDKKTLTAISVGKSVTSIRADAFNNTGWYNNQPNGILYLDNCCLGNKNNVRTRNITLDDGTRLVADESFLNHSTLTSVTIPNSVENIGNKAFANCGLRLVTLHCMIPPTCTDGAFDGCYSALLMIPEGTMMDYAIADEWYKFAKVQEIAGVEEVEVNIDAVEVARYDIYGRLLSEPTKGINIVKYSDGTTRKECVN